MSDAIPFCTFGATPSGMGPSGMGPSGMSPSGAGPSGTGPSGRISSDAVLRGLDRLLAERPGRETAGLSEVTRCLTAYREQVTRRVRQKGNPPGSLNRLARLNAVISALYGVHYPIGRPPWPLLQQARDSFAAVAAELHDAGEA